MSKKLRENTNWIDFPDDSLIRKSITHPKEIGEAMRGENGRIRFGAKLLKIGACTLLSLPKSASAKLPSRGAVMVEGTINGFNFKAPLEPDGNKGHWLLVERDMLEGAKVDAGDTIALEIGVSQEWPEPRLPEDLKKALNNSERANHVWKDITPAAHWDWIRWIRSTKNPETRRNRIEVACSKLEAGMRRPCCFNRNMCSETEVSNNGVLLPPEKQVSQGIPK
jgi:hypothetical protein